MSIYEQEGIMRGYTYQDVILLLQNINPERGDIWQIMKKELREWVNDEREDMMETLDEHRDEICEIAFPDVRRPLVNHPNWSAERVDALANDVIDFLANNELWLDVVLYYNGRRVRLTHDAAGAVVRKVEEDVDPRDYFEYVSVPHIMSMSFEGGLYEVLNGYYGAQLEDAFYNLLRKHGCYAELGNAWNLSCYEV